MQPRGGIARWSPRWSSSSSAAAATTLRNRSRRTDDASVDVHETRAARTVIRDAAAALRHRTAQDQYRGGEYPAAAFSLCLVLDEIALQPAACPTRSARPSPDTAGQSSITAARNDPHYGAA